MILLVVDTSGKNGSVAVARAGEGVNPDNVEVIEVSPLAGGTFSAQLVPQIAALLAKHWLKKADIGAFIVVSGPGSFTGLRVGLAAVKGLAEILQKPIVPVSLLEVMARSEIFVGAGAESTEAQTLHYVAALDAGRGEVFVGQFGFVVTGTAMAAPRCLSESLLSCEALADLMESSAVRWIATPDAAVAEFLKQKGPQKCSVLKQASRPPILRIATVGWNKLQSGESVGAAELEANYMRRSDAEIFGKPGI